MPSDYANDLMGRVGLDTTEWKKGITDINAGIKHIETGFQATAALMDDWGNSSDGLKKRIETLNDKLTLQKKKLDILKQAYEDEVDKNGESSKAAEELAKKMYQVKNEIDRTETSLNSYTKKLDDMALISDKTAQKLESFASKTKGLSLAAVAGLTALGAGIVKAGQNADELNTLAKQTGLTTEEIQKFKYAADLIDVELNDMTGALRKMTRNMISTSSEVKSAWDTLGVSTKNVYGETKGVTEIFYEVLEALSKVENETERDQLAMLLFGKSANDLAGIVDDGGQALRELGEEAEALGLIMSQDTVDSANELNDVIDKLKAKLSVSITKAFSENAGNLTESAEELADVIVDVVNAVAKMPPGVSKTVIAITALTAVLSPMLNVSSKAVSAIVKLRNAYKAKTAETVKSTASEAQHSTALSNTATAAGAASNGIKGIGTAAKAATPYIIAVAVALAGISVAYNKALNALKKNIEGTYNRLISKSNEYYDGVIESIEIEKESYEEAQGEKIAATEKYYDDKIDKLEDDLKAQKKAIQTEQDLLEEAHKKRISQLERERDLKLEVINIQEENTTAELQKQIDAIDALTEAEEKAEEEREEAEKLKELQDAIASAKTYAEKIEAEKEYKNYLLELERKKVLAERELKKQELQNQIENIRQQSSAKRDQIDAEYEAAKNLENDEYELAKRSLNLKLEALDTYIENETAKLEKAKEEKISIMREETISYVEELEKRIDKENELKSAAEARLEAEKQAEIKAANFTNVTNGEYWDKKRAERGGGLTFWETVWSTMMGSDGIVGNAKGTNFWRGGLTQINEEGGEILNLPRGTQIIPHDVSMEMARVAGQQSVTNNSNTTNNSYNYGAQQHVTVFKVGDRTLATAIEPAVSVRMSDNIYGRRRSGGATKRI